MGDENDITSEELQATEDALSALAAPKLTHQDFIDRAYDTIMAAKKRGHLLEEIHAALPRRMAFGTFESCLSRARFRRRVASGDAGAQEQKPAVRTQPRAVTPAAVPAPAPAVQRAAAPVPRPSATSLAERARNLPGAFDVKADRPRHQHQPGDRSDG